jgi:hypothetical protein
MRVWLLILFFLGLTTVFGDQQEIIIQGGVVYYKLIADACPPITISPTPSGDGFNLSRNLGAFCAQGFPPTQAERLFVLGSLAPGTYKIYENNPLLGSHFPKLVFTVSEANQKTISSFSRSANGAASFHVEAPLEVTCAIERSNDLHSWTEVGRVSGDSDFEEADETIETKNEILYYRVRLIPPEAKVVP